MVIYKDKKLSHISFSDLLFCSLYEEKYLLKNYQKVGDFHIFKIKRYNFAIFIYERCIFAVSNSFLKTLGYSLSNILYLDSRLFLSNVLDRLQQFDKKEFLYYIWS